MSTEAWQTLSEHLDEALELSDEDRAAWLRRLHEREPALATKLAGLLEARAQKVLRISVRPFAAAGSNGWRRDVDWTTRWSVCD
jgi:hypothetical protein